MKRTIRIFLLVWFGLTIVGLLLPQQLIMPVLGAGKGDYNPNTFWYYPWGKSVTHKGVDVFACSGTKVVSATYGLVLFAGTFGYGGNVVLVLGPKWRIHYYAHLKELRCKAFDWTNRGKPIGTVGASGNAAGKPPHLHYSITTLVPYPWRWDNSQQGWKKVFYLNPITYFENK